MRAALSFLLVLLGCGLAAGDAQADSVVTVCGKDRWPGDPRTDLSEAIQAGGRITFACSGAIKFTGSHGIARTTDIDGGHKVTLDGERNRMFGLGSSGAHVSFSRIVIEDAGLPAGAIPGSVIVGEGVVAFRDRTTVRASDRPVWILAGGLEIRNSTFERNKGQVLAISEGDVTIANSYFTDNSGLMLDSVGTQARISDTQFLRNGPLWFAGPACAVSIARSRFTAMASEGDGGAIRSGCKTSIEESRFERNHAKGHGGALYLSNEAALRRVQFIGNTAARSGGAIAAQWALHQPGTLSLRHSRLEDNASGMAGGGLYSGEVAGLRIGGTAFIGNRSGPGGGGAIYARQSLLDISGSLFRQNSGAVGGAIRTFCNAPMGRISNSIIAGNSAGSAAGAVHGDNLRFLNATIADNGDRPIRHGTACSGSSRIEFANSILQGGVTGACAGVDASQVFGDLGHNLQFPWSTCGSTIQAAPPLLGPFYAPLRPLSPATYAGDDKLCKAPPINGRDVFGTHRPQGPACSIGAVEGDLSQLMKRWRKRRSDED